MICMTECLLSAAFIGANAMMLIADTTDSDYKKLYNSLSDKKKLAFDEIKKERIYIWIKASIIAIFVSITFSKFNHYLFDSNVQFNKSCINILIFYGVQHLVYMLHPKKDWQLNHIESNSQAKLWLSKYKSMQHKWHMGLVLGIVGYYFLSITIFKPKEINSTHFNPSQFNPVQINSNDDLANVLMRFIPNKTI